VLAGSRCVVQSLFLRLLGLLGLLPTSIDDLDVIVQYRRNNGDHVCFDHPCPNILRPSYPNVDNALKCQIPFPHIHHIFASPGLEEAYQSLDAAVDCEDVSNSCRGCGEICEVVEGIDEWERRGAIEGSAVIQGGGDAHRRLVDIWDAEVDFSHDGDGGGGSAVAGNEEVWSWSITRFGGVSPNAQLYT
jgi:hypothetical protein